MQQILDFANRINKINENPYFIKLNKVPSKEKFIKSQEGFIIAIDYWSRLLGLILYNVPTDKERLIIVKNLFDEHGNGDINKSHVNTFKLFMESLGYNGYQLSDNNILENNYDSGIYNNKFIENIKNVVLSENWIFAISALGMIEYTYINVSNNIHNYAKNFLNPDEINHYNLHEILDLSHATDFFELVIPYYDDYNQDILNGIQKGYDIMYELYNSLSKYID